MSSPPLSSTGPDREPGRDDDLIRQRSRDKYARRAAGYDLTCGPTMPIRHRAVAALRLQPGDRVLDVGCGTGVSLPLLRQAVGEGGRVWGFDHSPEMLAQARAKVAAAGWTNVQVIESAAQQLQLPEPVDALLFHYTHDILRSPVALDALLSLARPGARVAVAGIKFLPRWLEPLNLWVYWKNLGYNGAPGELRTPWDRLAPRLQDWQRSDTQWGMGYLACGVVPAR